MNRAITAALVAYALIGIVTFGHSAAHRQIWLDKNCVTLDQRVRSEGLDCYTAAEGGALGAGLLWPLYWSWEAFS